MVGSNHKDQQMGHHLISNSISESSTESELLGLNKKTRSLSNVNGLFVGFNPKSSEFDSARSPTSPLDFWVFKNLATPFVRSPRSPQKSWGSSKVGLSIIDSLDDGKTIGVESKFRRSSISTFESPKSLPKNYGVFTRTQIKPLNLQKGNSTVVFETGETPFDPESFKNFRSCSLDSGRARLTNFSIDSTLENFGFRDGTIPLNSTSNFCEKDKVLVNSSSMNLNANPILARTARDFIGSLSADEIELSEDYTCVKKFGSNPKITHIFGDFVLECRNSDLTDFSKSREHDIKLETPNTYPSSNFLSSCYSCKKNLEGEDIYMFRGEKAFCSPNCRSQQILIEEEGEKEKVARASPGNPSKPKNCQLSETLMFIG